MKALFQIRYLMLISSVVFIGTSFSQSIATFSSVMPAAQTNYLVLPATHTFQKIIQANDALTTGGTMGANADFTGYVPIGGSSSYGYLSVSSETNPAEVAILTLELNPLTKLWKTAASGKVLLPFSDIGSTSNFCSGTVTPNNTIMVCEEATRTADGNADGYEDVGWIIEIDPATKTVIDQNGDNKADKLWAMGKQKHENVTINNTNTVAYWGADDATNGFVYKFIPTVAGKFGEGDLYVLATTGNAGIWVQIPNTTISQRNSTIAASLTANAHNFNRVEDVEIAPDGKVYFSSTNDGKVYRFTDNGTTVSNIETFVDNTSFLIAGLPTLFNWPDNLAFDGEGNLWVLQDGGDNHIWVVGPGHTAATPDIKIFANTPNGSEPTGITFSPDYNYLFLSIQHPSGSNTNVQFDAAGNEVYFTTHTTLVIARKENLGAGIVLSSAAINLQVKEASLGAELSWTTSLSNIKGFKVERSINGKDFTAITNINAVAFLPPTGYKFTDNNLPFTTKIYYRVEAISGNNSFTVSPTVEVNIKNLPSYIKLYPIPANNQLHIRFSCPLAQSTAITIFSSTGKKVYEGTRQATGASNFMLPLHSLASGLYTICFYVEGAVVSQSFIKK